MTTVFIEIIRPKDLYDILAVNEIDRVSDSIFINELREELTSSLGSCGVKNVMIKLAKSKQDNDYYKILIHNIKNDWQEEEIRSDCDDVCLSFMKKENLTKLKADIIK